MSLAYTGLKTFYYDYSKQKFGTCLSNSFARAFINVGYYTCSNLYHIAS